jgi:hypothetical protein
LLYNDRPLYNDRLLYNHWLLYNYRPLYNYWSLCIAIVVTMLMVMLVLMLMVLVVISTFILPRISRNYKWAQPYGGCKESYAERFCPKHKIPSFILIDESVYRQKNPITTYRSKFQIYIQVAPNHLHDRSCFLSMMFRALAVADTHFPL